MLGMAQGETALVEQPDGRRELILIDTVLYQPEAARRAVTEKHVMAARRPHKLTLVHSAAANDRPLGEMGKIRQTGEDDPGPSAA
jgi:regulator of nucleoside diphosphate kinase